MSVVLSHQVGGDLSQAREPNSVSLTRHALWQGSGITGTEWGAVQVIPEKTHVAWVSTVGTMESALFREPVGRVASFNVGDKGKKN